MRTMTSLILLLKGPRWQRSWVHHGAHLGPVSLRWAPCWPHKPCYQGKVSCFNHALITLLNNQSAIKHCVIIWQQRMQSLIASFMVPTWDPPGADRTHVCHYWFRSWLVAMITASHYLNHWWFIVSWTLSKKDWRKLFKIQNVSLKKMHLKHCLLKVSAQWGWMMHISVSKLDHYCF